MLYAVLVVALVVLDQAVKFLVRANIPLGGDCLLYTSPSPRDCS